MSGVPGINAKHAIITPTCRRSRGNAGAFDEALGRIWTEYSKLLAARGEDGAHYHLVLAVESKTPTERLRNIQNALNESEAGDPMTVRQPGCYKAHADIDPLERCSCGFSWAK